MRALGLSDVTRTNAHDITYDAIHDVLYYGECIQTRYVFFNILCNTGYRYPILNHTLQLIYLNLL